MSQEIVLHGLYCKWGQKWSNQIVSLVFAEARSEQWHEGQGVQAPRYPPAAVGAAVGELPARPPRQAPDARGERGEGTPSTSLRVCVRRNSCFTLAGVKNIYKCINNG